ncbi:MAG: methyltransferase domain-containing protein [Candidatus Eisenbacteria bacterium]|uniref:Methyltransferase domain-containing protein n=1 Tax=Eiseniibacteriota bacterium TaxID=2212470 RepID=A0A849T2F3_UNCEI|nr:methyltransferase domain-containing protein [Candidatus Eisenbacteria bacterium]
MLGLARLRVERVLQWKRLELACSSSSLEFWRGSPARVGAIGDASFDAIVWQNGVMFPTDEGAIYREMRRVLTPHGRAPFCAPLRARDRANKSHRQGDRGARIRRRERN